MMAMQNAQNLATIIRRTNRDVDGATIGHIMGISSNSRAARFVKSSTRKPVTLAHLRQVNFGYKA